MMAQSQSAQNHNLAAPTQVTHPVASAQTTTAAVTPPPQPNKELSSFWPVLPSLLWLALVVVLFIVFGKKIGQILTEFMLRLRSGAAIKVASVELGPMVVTSGQEVSQNEKETGVRPDKDKSRENERRGYRAKSRDIMLVHRLYRSREAGQLYDIVVYVVPHKQASLAGVNRVEYFLA